MLTIDDLAAFAAMLVDLYRGVAVPYVTSELYQSGSNVNMPEVPSVASIQMASPLVSQIAAGSNGIVALGLVGYILRNPERLGEFLPRIQEAWYNSRASAQEAKENLQRLNARGRFEASGTPIRAFERVYRDRERNLPDRTDPRSRGKNRRR